MPNLPNPFLCSDGRAEHAPAETSAAMSPLRGDVADASANGADHANAQPAAEQAAAH